MSGVSISAKRPGRSRGSDLTSGPIQRRLLDLWLPMIGGVFAVKVIGLSDAFFVGRLGQQPLAAISFTFPIVMTLITLAIGLSSGASSVLSRAIGAAGSRQERHEIVAGTLSLSAVLALMLAGAGFLTIRPLLSLLGAEGANLDDATMFMNIWFAGSLFLFLPIVANGLLRATGDGFSPAVLMTGIAVLNVAINPVFIFGLAGVPELGMQGAAVATVLARACASVGAFWLLLKRDLISLDPAMIRRGLRHWKEIGRIGAPASISTSVNPIALSVATAAAATIGEAEVAAFGVATKVQSIAIVPLLALSAASAPIAGQNSAAGEEGRTRAMLLWCAGISAGWAILAAAAFWLAGDWMAGQFVSGEASREALATYLLIVPISYAGYGVVVALSAGLNGLGRPFEALSVAAGRALLLLAPATWAGVFIGGFAGLAVSILIVNLLCGLIGLGLILRRPMTASGPGNAYDDNDSSC